MSKAYGKLLSFLNTSCMPINPFPADLTSQSRHRPDPLSAGLCAQRSSVMGKISRSPGENQSVHKLGAVLARMGSVMIPCSQRAVPRSA